MVLVTEGFAPGVNAPRFGVNAPNFCVSFLLRWLFSLKCRRKSRENPYQNHPTKNENVTKRALLSSKVYDYFFFFNFFHGAVALPVSNLGDWI